MIAAAAGDHGRMTETEQSLIADRARANFGVRKTPGATPTPNWPGQARTGGLTDGSAVKLLTIARQARQREGEGIGRMPWPSIHPHGAGRG